MGKVTTNIDTEIGRRLRQARLANNLTQSGLANLIGISFQQVQKYENGTNRVSTSRVWEIANVLKIPVTYFFEHLEQIDISKGAKFDEENTLPDRVMRIARLLNELPDGVVKDEIFGLVKAITKAGEN